MWDYCDVRSYSQFQVQRYVLALNGSPSLKLDIDLDLWCKSVRSDTWKLQIDTSHIPPYHTTSVIQTVYIFSGADPGFV